ncbi:hypothetical protein K491DRAFT_691096 [Lophiostoma macrostomum CBS 122681]|uniref:Protein kinase domain-containing protein n=1 Tax=Lophiostoma macrostomum CBS 122681 TaxID=1314788 RepID=A0A6A6TBW0_9PLEO|nr:hypothetical protein K491DRAFT_691096 [Lophiostoma macrostomum CBS 122681]
MELHDCLCPLELSRPESLHNNPQLATLPRSPDSDTPNTSLRKCVSLLELRKTAVARNTGRAVPETEQYAVENSLRLQVNNSLVPDRPDGTVVAEIVKTFTPFTMAAVMVVRIVAPAMMLDGDYVLKAYDRRFAIDIREEFGIEQWSPDHEMQFMKYSNDKELNEYAADLLSNDHVRYTGKDEATNDEGSDSDNSEASADNDGLQKAYYEMLIHIACLKMYRAELEVYRRTDPLWGFDVPRFLEQIQVSNYDSSHYVEKSPTAVQGILLQYVPGFSLTELYESKIPPIPRELWTPVIQDAIRVTHEFGKLGIRCDDNCPRNTIVHWDPIISAYRCMLIDFGHCQFRRPGWSDEDWGRFQACEDEEGGIGMEMQIWLQRKRGGGYVYVRSAHQDWLGQFRR